MQMNYLRIFTVSLLPALSVVGQSNITPGPVAQHQLPPLLRYLANYNGKRFLAPGLERLTVDATIVRGSLLPIPVRIIRELPAGIRIQEVGKPVLGSFASTVWKDGGTLSEADSALVEIILQDSIEGFLIGQASGSPTRLLGSRFRTDDGRASSYTGPYYDIYQVLTDVQTSTGRVSRWKRYAINSDTQLLERVSYQAQRSGAVTQVETRLGAWEKKDGEWFPTRLQSFENGKLVFTLVLTNPSFTAKLADGLLERP